MDASGAALLAAMLAAGLASGVHCVAMCGGIAAAFEGAAAHAPGPRVIPIHSRPDWRRRLAFNAGRISTYAAAGAVAGTLGDAAYAAATLPLQEVLKMALGLLLVVVGLRMAAPSLLVRAEVLTLPLWRRLQPAAARLMAVPGSRGAYVAGAVWGFLPCALIYAALAAATASGGAGRGALAMAAFGLGTLPFLLAAGSLTRRLFAWRRVLGALLLGSGAWGIAQAGPVAEGIRRGLLCF